MEPRSYWPLKLLGHHFDPGIGRVDNDDPLTAQVSIFKIVTQTLLQLEIGSKIGIVDLNSNI